ncbi:MAG: exodeoxyribonuclease V subunit beta [Zoogloeaceae bacterium]|nr:exodeoxyribonuclease V subunit beta [Zoogloeaceae bacterium]
MNASPDAAQQQQSQPLDVHGCPLDGAALIEASAGTGKTWAICGLALRLIAERGLAIHEVLVLTFTNAASAELRTRIRARLVEALAALENDLPPAEGPQDCNRSQDKIRARVGAALAAFDEAAIHTIHGFCQRALHESPFAAGEPFSLTLTMQEDLAREVAVDYWRHHIAHGALAPALVTWLAQKKFSPDQLEGLLRRVLAHPLAEVRWPVEEAAAHANPADSIDAAACHAKAKACWQAGRAEILALLTESADLARNRLRVDTLVDGAGAWDLYFASDNPATPIPEKAQKFRAATLAAATRNGRQPPAHPFFLLAEALCASQEKLEAQRSALLRHFLAWAPAEVRARQRARRHTDFDAQLGNLHTALNDPARGETLARALRKRYPAALIDEFQDTDPLQLAILRKIYGTAEGSSALFFVGDPKQAIYSFRQADLHTYLEARAATPRRFHLDANQRSSEGVIRGINALFGTNPRAFMLEDLVFHPARRGEKPLSRFSDQSAPARHALHLWRLPDGLRKDEAMTRAAQATAEEIARLLIAARKGEIRIDDAPLTPGRIAVLTRTHRQGQIMRQALEAVGLKAAELTRANIFTSAEAEELERFLHALHEPSNIGFLKGALATRAIGYDAAAIERLDTDEQNLAFWQERLHGWNRLWRQKGILAVLSEAGRILGLAGRLLQGSGGERRLTNHLHLTELLHEAETRMPEPARLLAWLAARRRQPEYDETEELRLESDRDLVSIVTIHRAKGLEYDIVFCPFLWETVHSPRRREPGILCHDQQSRRLLLDLGESEASKALARQEQDEELLRLYYVAITRAVHRCYLVHGPYLVRGSLTESSRSLLNWLVAGGECPPQQWSRQRLEAEALDAAWEALRAKADASMEAIPEARRPRLPAFETAGNFQAETARRRLLPGFRIDSFSGLIRNRREETQHAVDDGGGGDDGDHDDLALPPLEDVADPLPYAPYAPDILHFPRGPRAGDCIHALFEAIDFTHPENCREAARAALARHPVTLTADTDPSVLLAALEKLVADVLATPLPLPGAQTQFRLDCLAPDMRLTEFEFHLPVSRMESFRLETLLAAHGEPIPHLAAESLQGFLRGFIDLVFRHEGRYYVLDWKSNHLGGQPEDYGAAALARAMREHAYPLQARLYLLALHRHLQTRLPAYCPEQHLGGALYLFVRGVRPEWKNSGIHFLPPKVALLREMEAMLG